MKGVRIFDLTDFYERYFQKLPVLHLKDGWFALSHGFDLLHLNMQLRLKRIVDVSLALLTLLLTSPICILVAILIRMDSRGPVIYSQLRTGAHGKHFMLHKFRTMVSNAEENGAAWTRPDDDRITRVGWLLRKMRLDEIPQTWNVLKGDMSFIGPRPERPEFNDLLETNIPYFEMRYLVKPGITGWAQVMFPYGASVEDAREKLQYDLYYIKNYSLLLDLVIAVKTVRVILFGKGR
jgi:exopolysaccharide biosynthesis polyprenyl glycosylphosphotransferase